MKFSLFSRNSQEQQRTSRDRKPVVLAASSSSRARDEPDLSQASSLDLQSLMDRLSNDLGSIALFSGRELELLAELDAEDFVASNAAYDLTFVKQIQEAADRHLTEKREIRDALGLLKLYQKSSNSSPNSKRKRGKKWDLIVIFPIIYCMCLIHFYLLSRSFQQSNQKQARPQQM